MERRELTKPDCIAYLIESMMPEFYNPEKHYFYCDVILLFEVKVGDNLQNALDVTFIIFDLQNIRKLFYNANHSVTNTLRVSSLP